MSELNKPIATNHRSFWLNPFTVLGLTLVLFFSTQIIGVVLIQVFFSTVRSENYQLVLYMACSIIVLLLCLMIGKKLVGFRWSALGIRWPGFRWLAAVVPSFILYFVISITLSFLASYLIPHFNSGQVQDIGFKNLHRLPELAAAFFGLVVLTPLLEETIFRGMLFKGLRHRLPFWISAVLTSALFAFAHLQWNVAVDVFALSIIMCFLVERSNSIIPTMLLHALKNSLAFAFLFLIK